MVVQPATHPLSPRQRERERERESSSPSMPAVYDAEADVT
jgi:hypothetical protein